MVSSQFRSRSILSLLNILTLWLWNTDKVLSLKCCRLKVKLKFRTAMILIKCYVFSLDWEKHKCNKFCYILWYLSPYSTLGSVSDPILHIKGFISRFLALCQAQGNCQLIKPANPWTLSNLWTPQVKSTISKLAPCFNWTE